MPNTIKPFKAYALSYREQILYNHWFGGRKYPEVYANKKDAEGMAKESAEFSDEVVVIPVLITPIKPTKHG